MKCSKCSQQAILWCWVEVTKTPLCAECYAVKNYLFPEAKFNYRIGGVPVAVELAR